MGATLKYVKEFDFTPKAYAKGGKVCCKARGGEVGEVDSAANLKKYGKEGSKREEASDRKKAKGGGIFEKATGENYPSRASMTKHEKVETPRMQKEELIQRASVKGGKNLTTPRRSVPVAPVGPLIGLKCGGKAAKK